MSTYERVFGTIKVKESHVSVLIRTKAEIEKIMKGSKCSNQIS